MQLEMPAGIRGNGPTLATYVEIGNILENAAEEPPLSLAEIGRRMEAKRVRHETIRACVEFLASQGYVIRTPKGALWALNTHPELWENTIPL